MLPCASAPSRLQVEIEIVSFVCARIATPWAYPQSTVHHRQRIAAAAAMGLFSSSKRSKAPKEARARKSFGGGDAPASGKDWPSLSPVPSECHALHARHASAHAGAGNLSPRDLIPSFVPSPGGHATPGNHGCTSPGEGGAAVAAAATPAAAGCAACLDEEEGFLRLEPSALSDTLAHIEAADTQHSTWAHEGAFPVGCSVQPQTCLHPARDTQAKVLVCLPTLLLLLHFCTRVALHGPAAGGWRQVRAALHVQVLY